VSALKLIHLSTITITISLFVIRGIGLFLNAGFMSQTWIRIVPHINDTILLISGIWLAIQIEQYPLVDSWLTAKLLALLLYIVLGLAVFRFAHNRRQQVSFWILAILVFVYMLGVAIRHDPMSWMHGFI
jgi:uncharacterized membrane protein SirB2